MVAIHGFTSALTSTSTCEALTASFKYDVLGRRIEKAINGRTIQYLYDGQDIVQEVENGQVTVNYIRTLNIDEPLARVESSGVVRYYQQDALGSVIALTDETGNMKAQYIYDPFGNVTITGEESDNPFQYTGRENDGTGLYYYRARYYSPELQRFISEDPIRLDSGDVNFYAYVTNNPINLADPIGLSDKAPPIIRNPTPDDPSKCDTNCGKWKTLYPVMGFFNCTCVMQCVAESGRVIKRKSQIGIRGRAGCYCESEGRICCAGKND